MSKTIKSNKTLSREKISKAIERHEKNFFTINQIFRDMEITVAEILYRIQHLEAKAGLSTDEIKAFIEAAIEKTKEQAMEQVIKEQAPILQKLAKHDTKKTS